MATCGQTYGLWPRGRARRPRRYRRDLGVALGDKANVIAGGVFLADLPEVGIDKLHIGNFHRLVFKRVSYRVRHRLLGLRRKSHRFKAVAVFIAHRFGGFFADARHVETAAAEVFKRHIPVNRFALTFERNVLHQLKLYGYENPGNVGGEPHDGKVFVTGVVDSEIEG